MIDPTSKDDPKFKELVKVRSASVSTFHSRCWAASGGAEGEGLSPKDGPRGQGGGGGRAGAPGTASEPRRCLLRPLPDFLSSGSAVRPYLWHLCASSCGLWF